MHKVKPEFYILCYHKISDAPINAKYPGLYVSEKVLDFHIKTLKRKGANFVTLTEFEKIYSSLYSNKFINSSKLKFYNLFNAINNFKIIKRPGLFAYLTDNLKLILAKKKMFTRKKNSKSYVIITFDDGSESVYKNAFQILKSNDIKATIFVISDLISGLNEWDIKNGEIADRLLSHEQIREMVEYGIEIGAHTRTHPYLTAMPPDKAYNEIIESKKNIENIFNIKVNFFAYPYGDFNAAIKKAVKKADFLGACSTKPGIVEANADFFELHRIDMKWNTYLFKLKRLIFNRI